MHFACGLSCLLQETNFVVVVDDDFILAFFGLVLSTFLKNLSTERSNC